MSPRSLKGQVDLWRNELPVVQPFYAIKCNPDPTILHALYDSDVHFDCASTRELLSIQDLSRIPSDTTRRIVYANPCKSGRDITVAKELGSPVTVVDSPEELEKLEGYKGGALIRIAVDDRASLMPFSSKFGATFTSVPVISHLAKESGVDIHGISFHVGSSCLSGKIYSDAIRNAYKCLQDVRMAGHQEACTIDIGGGYLPCEADFKYKSAHIRDAIIDINKQELLNGLEGVSFIAEPGRFFATNTFDFFVQVIGKKRSKQFWSYTIDDSVYGQFTSVLFDYAEPQWIRIQASSEKPRKYSSGVIFGRTCDSVDIIAKAEYMEELEVGDWLWFPGMGAYTRATASEFNGFPLPKIFVNSDVPDSNHLSFHFSKPKGVQYVPPVSVKSFWETKGTKIDDTTPL